MTTLNLVLTQNTDDATSVGTTFTDSGILYWGTLISGVENKLGVRFQNVTIPQGSTITSAVIDFVHHYNGDYASHTKSRLYGEASDNAATFSNGSQPKDRSLTTAFANWNSVSGTGFIDTYTSTSVNAAPDIASIIQEIVNRPGWASGNSLAIIGRDNGSDDDWGWEFYSYNDTPPTHTPKLGIVYTAPAAGGAGKNRTLMGFG
jgi:hypothetical protein